MNRFMSIMAIVVVVLLAMGFAAANAGNRVTLDLGLFTLYRIPVTLVAFGGLFVGMVLMFITGVHSDLKVRRILRERLAEEFREEQGWVDRDQGDLFVSDPGDGGDGEEESQRRTVGAGLEKEGIPPLAEEDPEVGASADAEDAPGPPGVGPAEDEGPAPGDNPEARFGGSS